MVWGNGRQFLSAVVMATTAIWVGAATAWAGPAGLVQGYNGVTVAMSSDVAKCGLKDADSYSAYLAERLFEANVELDVLLPASARLALSAKPFAQIGGKCVVMATLAFTVPLQAGEIQIEAADKRRRVIAGMFEQMDTLPVVIYESGEFTVSEANAGDLAALNLIDQLARKFGAAR
jgi:hypothetical protein